MYFIAVLPDQVDDQGAVFRIGSTGQDSQRFVEQDIDLLLPFEFRVDLTPAHFDVIALRIGLDAEFGYDAAVDRHFARHNQFFSLPARSDAGRRYDLL